MTAAGVAAGKGAAPAGLPAAVWSASTSMQFAAKTTSSGKPIRATIHLSTNVPPLDGGAVKAEDANLPSNHFGPEGRWRAGLSVVKSALQKNVRLCRPDSAVRWVWPLIKYTAVRPPSKVRVNK